MSPSPIYIQGKGSLRLCEEDTSRLYTSSHAALQMSCHQRPAATVSKEPFLKVQHRDRIFSYATILTPVRGLYRRSDMHARGEDHGRRGAFGTQQKCAPFAARAPGLAVSVPKYRRARNDRLYAQRECHSEVDVVSS